MSQGDSKPPADHEIPEFGPPVTATGGTRSCLLYGCVAVAALGMLATVAAGVAVMLLYRYSDALVDRFTSDRPAAIPVVEMPAPEVETVRGRLESFRAAAQAGEPRSLELTEREINALIARKPDLRGKVAIRLEDGRIRAEVSLPLEKLGLAETFLSRLRGRYFNGIATLEPAIENNELVARIAELEVQGRKLPQELLAKVQRNDALSIVLSDHWEPHDPLRQIRRCEVRDDRLIITLDPGPPGPPPPPRRPGPPPPPGP